MFSHVKDANTKKGKYEKKKNFFCFFAAFDQRRGCLLEQRKLSEPSNIADAVRC